MCKEKTGVSYDGVEEVMFNPCTELVEALEEVASLKEALKTIHNISRNGGLGHGVTLRSFIREHLDQ